MAQQARSRSKIRTTGSWPGLQPGESSRAAAGEMLVGGAGRTATRDGGLGCQAHMSADSL
jgi:hypothetical protein